MTSLFKWILASAWLAAFSFVLPVSTALADGIYIPPKAYRKLPAIQSQRALLKWKDDQETLVIASTLDSESQSLGWIIPLPAVPGEIAKADPGALKTLSFCVQPRITHDLSEEARFATLSALFAILAVATLLFRKQRLGDLLALLLLLLFLFLLFGLLMPVYSLGGSSVRKPSSLRVEKTAKVGSYEIAVLSAKKVNDLNLWLAGNGFSSFPDAANAIVAKYIKENWVFAAIKLTREGTGSNTPHPIQMTFPSKDAVYPLQLTAVAGSAPMFELFVLGVKRANSELLRTEFCDLYAKMVWELQRKERKEDFLAIKSNQGIGQPDICKLMWDGCVLTKLSGVISPANMGNDLKVQWSDYQPCREHLYSVKGARTESCIWFVSLFGACVIVTLILHRKRIKMPRGFLWWLGRRALPAAFGCGAVALIYYVIAPKLPSDETQISSRVYGMLHVYHLKAVVSLAISDDPSFSKKTESEIAAAIIRKYGEVLESPNPTNPIFGGDLTSDSTPGNFTVEKQGNKVVVRVYDAIGHPVVLEFDPEHPNLQIK